MHLFRLLTRWMTILLLFSVVHNASAQTWHVNHSHTLIWDGKPFLPIGVAFSPESLFSNSKSSWDHDKNELDTLKTDGVSNILIQPGQTLVDTTPASLQKLLNYLDSNGFHYGISFGKGITSSLTGFEILPSVFNYKDQKSDQASWVVKDTDEAAYFVSSIENGTSTLTASGKADIQGDAAYAPFHPDGTSNSVVYLIPHINIPTTDNISFPDVWGGFDAYRDRLLALFKQISIGSGLRFFLNPLGENIQFTDKTANLVPDSESFRIDWESWLEREFGTVKNLSGRWGLEDGPESIRALARLMPLWSRDHGTPYMFDPGTGKTYKAHLIGSSLSPWWDDFNRWRFSSLLRLYNGMADILKNQIAPVPVVYTYYPSNAAFEKPASENGFDGLAISTSAFDSNRSARSSGPAYVQADLSEKPLWLMAAPILSSSINSADNIDLRAYDSLRALESDLGSLHSNGFKALYLSIPGKDSLLSSWITRAETDLNIDPATVASLKPRTLFFPAGTPGPAQIGNVPGSTDVLWLPAPLHGNSLDWWPSFSGYTAVMPDGKEVTVLLSLLGPRTVHLFIPDVKVMHVTDPEGDPVIAKKIGKDEFEIHFGDSPLVFSGSSQLLMPEESASDAISAGMYLLKIALAEKSQSSDYAKIQMDQAVLLFHKKNYVGAYQLARPQIESLAADLQPYTWMEGEASGSNNFTEIAQNPEASHGAYLRLDTSQPPVTAPNYGVRYTFNAPSSGLYTVWLAGTLPGPDISPFSWYMDAGYPDAKPPHDPAPHGPRYLSNYFGWMFLGNATLTKGDHALTIKVDGPASATGNYRFAIDTIVIAPASYPFSPYTTILPPPIPAEAFLKLINKK